MKRFGIFLVCCVIIGSFLFITDKSLPGQINHFINYSSCDTPIAYAIGRVDTQFNVSPDTFASDIQQATSLWSDAEGKKLFVYDPSSDFHINLIYDQRQFLDTKINQLQNQVNTNDTQLKTQINAYKVQVQDFKNRLQKLNDQIDYWNKRGGAPQDTYNQLIQQQKQLQQEGNQLNAQAKQLNISTENYDSQVDVLNQTVSSYNQLLVQKPEEGLFDPQNNIINIYFDTTQEEFIHTIAHELGHSLGLQHNQNPQSIMYPYTTKTTMLSDTDKQALQEICRVHPLTERFTTNFKYIIQLVSSYIKQKQQ